MSAPPFRAFVEGLLRQLQRGLEGKHVRWATDRFPPGEEAAKAAIADLAYYIWAPRPGRREIAGLTPHGVSILRTQSPQPLSAYPRPIAEGAEALRQLLEAGKLKEVAAEMRRAGVGSGGIAEAAARLIMPETFFVPPSTAPAAKLAGASESGLVEMAETLARHWAPRFKIGRWWLPNLEAEIFARMVAGLAGATKYGWPPPAPQPARARWGPGRAVSKKMEAAGLPLTLPAIEDIIRRASTAREGEPLYLVRPQKVWESISKHGAANPAIRDIANRLLEAPIGQETFKRLQNPQTAGEKEVRRLIDEIMSAGVPVRPARGIGGDVDIDDFVQRFEVEPSGEAPEGGKRPPVKRKESLLDRPWSPGTSTHDIGAAGRLMAVYAPMPRDVAEILKSMVKALPPPRVGTRTVQASLRELVEKHLGRPVKLRGLGRASLGEALRIYERAPGEVATGLTGIELHNLWRDMAAEVGGKMQGDMWTKITHKLTAPPEQNGLGWKLEHTKTPRGVEYELTSPGGMRLRVGDMTAVGLMPGSLNRAQRVSAKHRDRVMSAIADLVMAARDAKLPLSAELQGRLRLALGQGAENPVRASVLGLEGALRKTVGEPAVEYSNLAAKLDPSPPADRTWRGHEHEADVIFTDLAKSGTPYGRRAGAFLDELKLIGRMDNLPAMERLESVAKVNSPWLGDFLLRLESAIRQGGVNKITPRDAARLRGLPDGLVHAIWQSVIGRVKAGGVGWEKNLEEVEHHLAKMGVPDHDLYLAYLAPAGARDRMVNPPRELPLPVAEAVEGIEDEG